MAPPAPLSRAKRLAFTGIAFAIGAALLEGISALALLPALTGPSARGGAVAPAGVFGVEAGAPQPLAVHPYLGYVLDPRMQGGVSTFGFLSDPLAPRPAGGLVVGIFGASVADQLFGARSALEKSLKRHPALAGRTIEFRNYALGGYKQPQQLLALSLFLALGSELDAVVSLDGFNEVTLPVVENEKAGVYAFFPRQWALLTEGLPDRRLGTLIGRIALDEERRDGVRRFLSTSPFAVSRTVRAASLLYAQLLDSRLSRLRFALHEASSAPASESFGRGGPAIRLPTGADRWRALASVWRRGALQMDRLCRENRIAFLEALQPNQYVPGSREFGEAERKVARNEDHPYRRAVEAGYPELVRAGEALRADGVPYVDLTNVFRDEPEPVYADACCHLTARGIEIVADQIGDRLAPLLAERAVAAPPVAR